MAFRKIEAGLVNADVDQFIGKTGTIFYDNSLGDFRISDGQTPGGIALSFGGGGGGTYTLPTATTTVKGGVKIDGSTITIANQVISVGTVPYSSVSGTPTIPTNTNQLTNGANYITSAALSGYATESYVTTRGYLTAVSWNDISSKPTFATVATSGSYADLTNKPTLFSGSYTDLTNKPTLVTSYTQLTDRPTLFSGSYTDLTNKPTIPTDINQLTDESGLLEGGGGGGGTTYITNTVENPYSWSIAGDDSTLREIANGESIKISGSSGITVTTDAEGNVTITGPSLAGLATESYVTSQGYITSSALTGLATETYVTTRGYITSAALTGLATESYVTSRGYITGLSWNQLTDKPNLAGTYSFSVAADDSTLREISSDETVKFIGSGGITTASDAEGNITITGPNLSSYATETFVTTQGYITSSALTGLATESYVNQAVTNLVDDAPAMLDTLKELALSLNNDSNLAATLITEINKKANIADLVLTIAGDDSTEKTISLGEGIRLQGTGSITITTDLEGKVTINGAAPDLSSYATQSYVTSQGYITNSALTGLASESFVTTRGYITGLSWNDLTDKPNLAGTYTFNVAADDSTMREISSEETVKFIGAGGITTASDAEGNITITGAAQDRLTSNGRSAILNSNGTFSLPTLTAEPSTPQAGQMALADGVSWDPISQGGTIPYMTIYTGATWIGFGGTGGTGSGVTVDQVYNMILEMG